MHNFHIVVAPALLGIKSLNRPSSRASRACGCRCRKPGPCRKSLDVRCRAAAPALHEQQLAQPISSRVSPDWPGSFVASTVATISKSDDSPFRTDMTGSLFLIVSHMDVSWACRCLAREKFLINGSPEPASLQHVQRRKLSFKLKSSRAVYTDRVLPSSSASSPVLTSRQYCGMYHKPAAKSLWRQACARAKCLHPHPHNCGLMNGRTHASIKISCKLASLE